MIYFLLPNANLTIYKQIDCQFSETIPEITISNSLAHYLFEIKNKIKHYGVPGSPPRKHLEGGYENEWNEYKKYTNPYEFINTIIPGKNKCVSKYKSLSRSYFKMVEILDFLIHYREPGSHYDDHSIEVNLACDTPIHTFHLAEGPGGFIEATANFRKNGADKYYGMTILDDAENCKLYSLPEIQEKGMNVPGWKKTEAFLRTHPNVLLEHGVDGTGNILSFENFIHCREKYGGTMDFITADGGFDFSIDFNNQETNIAALLFAQMCYALCLQKQGGHFVLKIFDCFMDHTVDILYILSSMYENVYIIKPNTSRYANSEKYMVCKNFLMANDSVFFPFLRDTFQKMLAPPSTNPPLYITRFLRTPVPIYYIYRLEEYNAIFGQQQIENIYQTMILIENTGNQRFMKCSGLFSRSMKKMGGSTGANEETEKQWSREHIDTIDSYDDNSNYKMMVIQHPKVENLIRTNIQKCIQWCMKHNIPIEQSLIGQLTPKCVL